MDPQGAKKVQVKMRGKSGPLLNNDTGCKQGDCLAPCLALFAIDAFFKKFEELAQGVEGAGVKVELDGVVEELLTVLFADDAMAMADRGSALQGLADCLALASKYWGMPVNAQKTETMSKDIEREIAKEDGEQQVQARTQITMGGQQIKNVVECTYLGTKVATCGEHAEVAYRIGKAKRAFYLNSAVLCNRRLSLRVRKTLLSSLVLSVLFYGLESIGLTADAVNRIENAQSWMVRRMMWKKQIQRVSLKGMREKLRVTTAKSALVKRKMLWMGKVYRCKKMASIRVKCFGKMVGRKRRRGTKSFLVEMQKMAAGIDQDWKAKIQKGAEWRKAVTEKTEVYQTDAERRREQNKVKEAEE